MFHKKKKLISVELKNAALTAFLIFPTMLLTACDRAPKSRSIDEDGYWVSRLGEMKEFYPCGDDRYAWGISAEGNRLTLLPDYGGSSLGKTLLLTGKVQRMWPVKTRINYFCWVELANG